MSLATKLQPTPQRRLLSLDGGGVRGAIAIEVLAAMEDLLRTRTGAGDDFRLSHYFDYVAGTSTGAIIATCVALGMSAAQIRTFYNSNGSAMFQKSSLLDRWRQKYEDDRLNEKLRSVFHHGGEDPTAPPVTLGSDALETLLLIVMRNATTNSPWPVSNNPRALYNDPSRDDCNLHIPLWQLVRASAAAPVFFPPEEVRIGSNTFLFVDGGVTTYNNPAFLLFLMATLPSYRLEWPTGVDKLLLVSVGTGTTAQPDAHLTAHDMNLFYNVTAIPTALMFAASTEQDYLCRVFGRVVNGSPIDSEVGTLRLDPETEAHLPFPKLFTYARYNLELSRDSLDGLGLKDIDPARVRRLDSVEALPDLGRIGRALAATVSPDHFAGFLP